MMMMEMLPTQRDGETQPFFPSSSSSLSISPPTASSSPPPPITTSASSSSIRRSFYHRSVRWRRLLKWMWRDVAFLCVGLLLGFLIFKLTIGTVGEGTKGQKDTLESALDFFVIGDWGRRGLYNQSQVAIQVYL